MFQQQKQEIITQMKKSLSFILKKELRYICLIGLRTDSPS